MTHSTVPSASLTAFCLWLILCLSLKAAPTVTVLNPAAGATVSALTQISVTFNEAVTGVDADDLEINGEAAAQVSGSGAGPYVFTFTQPPAGAVLAEWAGDHGIAGQGGTGAFVPGAAWSYTLTDTIAPALTQTTPASGATVGALTQVEVVFSEEVVGVDAADLLVNGTPADGVTRSGAGPYIFSFALPPEGTVNFTWAASPGITDLSPAANAFAGAGWSVTLSAAGIGNIVINEFLAANGTGLVDENADPEDWIELYNPGTTAVNLVGWALSNELDELDKWTFPSRTIAAGGRLVVFASGKNRKPGSGNLHTNFTLNENGGDLVLVGPQSPRVVVSSFAAFPGQRTDYSYGPRPSDGALRYFSPPTPNAANNSANTFTAATPEVAASVQRGFFKDPFQLVLSCSDAAATIRYTTNFTEPTAASTLYSGPITISATTCVRAVAFSSGKIPSLPVTHSYIFLDQVLSQPANPAGFPADWGAGYGSNVFTPASSTPGLVPADYAMDTDPLRVTPTNPGSAVDPAKLARYNASLRELPLVSIVMPMIDMFGANGHYYYPNVTNKNFGYKKCSVEMILPDGSTAFSTTCGISGHGNASRDPLKNPKHGFQIKFKGDYGPGSLEYPIFPETPVSSYDDIILRPDFGTSWRHWSDSTSNSLGNNQRSRATRTRDAFVKDTFRDMGRLASHHRFFHLFINGLYWGTYDFAEQPVEGFISSNLGGPKADYAIIHEGIEKNGTDTIYTTMTNMGQITTNALYEQMKGYLEVPVYIDYLLMQFYVGAQDWGGTKNWYAYRRRATTQNPLAGKYNYVPWDEENTLLDTTIDRINADPNGYGLPGGLHAKLVTHAQYRLDFADRVHRHLIAPGGALTTPANVARWQKWQAIMDKPIVAESVRWGDYRRDFHSYQDGAYVLYTRETQWLAENTRVTGTYFPGRTGTLLGQLRTGGLYPPTTAQAPELRQGTVTGTIVGTSQIDAGYVLAMSVPAGTTGTIHFTTDGNDPHIYYTPTTGAGPSSIAATAQAYSAPITLNATTTIKARILTSTGVWTALNEATFTVGSVLPSIRITEIMYNPPGGSAREFIEVQNTGPLPVDLGAWFFEGVEFYFPLGTLLNPGDRLVLGNNDGDNGAFAAYYPGVAVFGWFGGSLDNAGERLALKDKTGRTIVSVDYRDVAPWPTSPDGGGPSLEIVDPDGDPDDYSNWKASNAVKGTPGAANSPRPATAVVLNEVLAVNAGGVVVNGGANGYVELRNTSSSAVDLNGWSIQAGAGSFTFGVGASIGGNSFQAVPVGPGQSLPASLPAGGAVVQLRNAAGAVVDAIAFGNQIADRAIGRVSGPWVLTVPTLAADNTAASLAAPAGNLVLNEWLSNHGPGGTDWIELYNKHATLPVALAGLSFQTDTQRYRFSALSFVAPGGFLQLFASELPGVNQLDFHLPPEGTALAILDAVGGTIDSLTAAQFGVLGENVSRGRNPDGSGTIVTFTTGASPAAANYVISWTGPTLNEVVARNASGAQAPWGARADWVELWNPDAAPFDVGGMRLATASTGGVSWTIPSGVSIAAGSHLAVWCDPAQAASTISGADLNSALPLGDFSGGLFLFNAAGQLVSQIEWGAQLVDRAIGVEAGSWKLLASPTRGAANAAAAALGSAAGLKINEWMAAPASGNDWFELYNPAANPVALAGLYLTDDPSELGRTKFVIAPLSFIDGPGWLRFDAASAPELGRTHVNFSLATGAEFLRLSAADLSVIDVVSFGQQTTGVSQGRVLNGTANIVAMPGSPTPGASNILLPAPTIQTQPDDETVAQGGPASFSIAATGSAPLSYQWKFNGGDIPGQTGTTLSLTNVLPAQDGRYTCVVTNTAGSVLSATAMLYVQQTFAQWATSNGLGGGAAVGDDPEFDSLANGLEYFLNLNPLAPPTPQERADALPRVGMETIGETRYLTLTYRQSARAVPGAAQLQLSPALATGSWTNVTPDITEPLGLDPLTGDPRVRLKVAIGAGETRKYLRLEVVP